MYTDSPKTDDAVAFIMETYSDEGVLKNPYSVEQVLIYHIQRHSHSNDRLLEIKELNQDLEEMHEELISQKETTPQLLKQLTG
ncbi:MAG: hypothetical protein GTO02_20950, partial [Candidatus Dadabacteria bacterium]|nr:hypothetical protein [Candidatus Dadabacteria bacterium]